MLKYINYISQERLFTKLNRQDIYNIKIYNQIFKNTNLHTVYVYQTLRNIPLNNHERQNENKIIDFVPILKIIRIISS